MSAPVFLVRPEQLQAADGVSAVPSRVVVDGPEGRHAVSVARLLAGERVDLVDGQGRRARATVVSAERPDRLTVQVQAIAWEPQPQPTLVVVQALIKGDRADRAIESMTEVGVDVIVPWQAQRSIVRWDAKAARARAKWQAAATEAAKQSRRARVPQVRECLDLDELVALVGAAESSLLLHEEAQAPIAAAPIPQRGTVVLVVGPEGGLSPAERTALAAAGAREVHLGPTVLRAATAGTVAASVVLSRTDRWGVAGSPA